MRDQTSGLSTLLNCCCVFQIACRISLAVEREMVSRIKEPTVVRERPEHVSRTPACTNQRWGEGRRTPVATPQRARTLTGNFDRSWRCNSTVFLLLFLQACSPQRRDRGPLVALPRPSQISPVWNPKPAADTLQPPEPRREPPDAGHCLCWRG